MNKTLLTIASLFFGLNTFAQAYDFQTIKNIEATPVTAQENTGTCWSFSSTSFLEAEIIRTTGTTIDLSEMYNVRNTYLDKGENYVSRQGKAQFGEGGLNHDVINSALKYGIALQNEFSGKIYDTAKHDHTRLVKELNAILKKAVEDTPVKYPTWKTDYTAVLDKYMGTTANVKPISAAAFLANYKINLHDYVTITSFTHQPVYSQFILNIPDNFANGSFYNLPLDEFVQNIDYALDKGFTVAIDSDVSEATFSTRTGVAVIPENAEDVNLIKVEIKPEKKITPEFRQAEFENYNTTDDHLMHIVGKSKDQKGNIYYKVKNSWGNKSGIEGYVYMSVSYLRLKAISVLLHKDALMPQTKKALGL
ncbi:C1 family peptidase [Flavobacterium terrisoli]|uniref:C1 family peptidase n=1 Tax=Flavobacterium terrisoli TaxID=3242195 RepID=UPI002542963C|nr:C1 family peptidase [Flavobacterium buctense]